MKRKLITQEFQQRKCNSLENKCFNSGVVPLDSTGKLISNCDEVDELNNSLASHVECTADSRTTWNLSQIPDSILANIFSFTYSSYDCLPLREVCHSFDRVLWRSDLIPYTLDSDEHSLFSLIFKIKNVPLCFINFKSSNSSILLASLQNMVLSQSLRYLCIHSEETFLDIDLANLLKHFNSLECLIINGKLVQTCSNEEEWNNLTKDYVKQWKLEKLSHISLHLKSCNFLFKTICNCISTYNYETPIHLDLKQEPSENESCEFLDNLKIPKNIKSCSFVHIPIQFSIKFIEMHKYLKKLTIENKLLPISLFQTIHKELHFLESLDLSGVIDSVFPFTMNSIHSLKKLKISNLNWFCPKIFPLQLAGDLLESLYVDSNNFSLFRRRFPKLRKLYISINNPSYYKNSLELYKHLLMTSMIDNLEIIGPTEMLSEIIQIASTTPTIRKLKIHCDSLPIVKQNISIFKNLTELEIMLHIISWDQCLFWSIIAPNADPSFFSHCKILFPQALLVQLSQCTDFRKKLYILIAVIKKELNLILSWIYEEDREYAIRLCNEKFLLPLKDLYNNEQKISLHNIPQLPRYLLHNLFKSPSENWTEGEYSYLT